MFDGTPRDFDRAVVRAYDRTIRQDHLRKSFGMSGPRQDSLDFERRPGFPCDGTDLLDLVFAIERAARRPVIAEPASSPARRPD